MFSNDIMLMDTELQNSVTEKMATAGSDYEDSNTGNSSRAQKVTITWLRRTVISDC